MHAFKYLRKGNLHRSFKQSSLLFKRSLISPDTSTEYGQAISFKKPLISSWKLSRSSLPLKKTNQNTFTEQNTYNLIVTTLLLVDLKFTANLKLSLSHIVLRYMIPKFKVNEIISI